MFCISCREKKEEKSLQEKKKEKTIEGEGLGNARGSGSERANKK